MTIEELKTKLKGIVVVQLFPFAENGDLELDKLRENTEFLSRFHDGGNRDMVILTNGSTSEFYAMSDEEQLQAISTVVKASGNTPVVAGAARPGTRETIRFAKKVEELGVDGIMVVLPYYHQATVEGMFRHYEAINAALETGIMLYNNPFVSGSWAGPDLLARISKLPRIIAVKENTSDAIGYQDICRKTDPDDLIMICGLGERMYPAACAYRCEGFVTDIANFAPELAYEVYEAGRAGDHTRTNRALSKLGPYFDAMAKFLAARAETSIMPDTRRGNSVYQAMAKFALGYTGLNGGEMRLPMLGLSESEKKELETALQTMGLTSNQWKTPR